MQSSVTRTQPSSSSLKDTIEVILDKGIVIDAYVRISLVGIELITIDARIVIASIETYLKYAEKVDRINLRDKSEAMNLGSLFGAGHKSNSNSSDNDDDGENSGGLTRALINNVVDKAVSKIK